MIGYIYKDLCIWSHNLTLLSVGGNIYLQYWEVTRDIFQYRVMKTFQKEC